MTKRFGDFAAVDNLSFSVDDGQVVGFLGVSGAGETTTMSASGIGESSLGDPLWSTLSEWADACHVRGGSAVAAHFPFPGAEWAASVVPGTQKAHSMTIAHQIAYRIYVSSFSTFRLQRQEPAIQDQRLAIHVVGGI